MSAAPLCRQVALSWKSGDNAGRADFVERQDPRVHKEHEVSTDKQCRGSWPCPHVGATGGSSSASVAFEGTIFTTPGLPFNWSVPVGAKTVMIQAWGGGGSSATFTCRTTTAGDEQYCMCSGGGGGAFAMGTFNLTGVTQLTITVGAAGSGHANGGETLVIDAQTKGQLIRVQSAGGQSLTSGTFCATGIAESVTLLTGSNTPLEAAGGAATSPSGSNLQPNTKLSVNGGKSEAAYALDTTVLTATMYVQGGRGGATYPSVAGAAGGSIVCPNTVDTLCQAQVSTPLVPGQGAGGGAISASSAVQAGLLSTINGVNGGTGMVILTTA